jgi:catechol 2,3-dioxygenase-like lactoylglutathione lyase family enzyme
MWQRAVEDLTAMSAVVSRRRTRVSRSLRGRVTVRPLYTGLRVRNLSRSIRFYRALGFRSILRLRTAIGNCVQLEHPTNHFTIELNQFRRGGRVYEPYRKGSEMDHFGFWVDDVDRWVRRLVRVGGKVKWAPYNTPLVIPPKPWFNGRAAYVVDPDGIWVELMGPARAGHHKR